MTGAIKNQFPGLNLEVNGYPLAYLDNAASTQVPERVLNAMDGYYRSGHANIDRGVHELGQRATRNYERARERVGEFIGAHAAGEVVFVRGTTEAANLVAQAYLGNTLMPDERVVVTEMEHHSNYLPWYEICASKGAHLDVGLVKDDGQLDVDHLKGLLVQPGCKFLALTHVSNVLGTINPVKDLVAFARTNGVRVFVDGAQAVPHFPVDVEDIGCDFYAFSGHKVHGPTGIGALYGKGDIFQEMNPWQTGGGMVLTIDSGTATYKEAPAKFEAGTPNIVGAVGIAEAVLFVQDMFSAGFQVQEGDLLKYLEQQLSSVNRVRLLAQPSSRVGVVSFVFDGVHAHDVGSILDTYGVAVRVGHHCAMPLMRRLGVPATVRVSLACYNSREDIDALMRGLTSVDKLFPPVESYGQS